MTILLRGRGLFLSTLPTQAQIERVHHPVHGLDVGDLLSITLSQPGQEPTLDSASLRWSVRLLGIGIGFDHPEQ